MSKENASMKAFSYLLLIATFCLTIFPKSNAQLIAEMGSSRENLNKPEREEWLQDAGFGIFIHWSLDSQLGTVISHSLVGASDDYVDRYINELPKTFNPTRFDADEMARMFKVAGAKYVVFTTKHHSGFCMWDTKTTDFKITNTPYRKDLLRELVDAVRKWDMDVGFYYSPEDFVFFYQNGIKDFNRTTKDKDILPIKDKYIAMVKAQMRELFTDYGKVDIFFNDGSVYGVANPIAWELQPDVLITRGAIPTPEQHIPGIGTPGAWESNMTWGTQWQYKPNDDVYKDSETTIETLIETRAKGGALLLNIGPQPNGELDDKAFRNLITLSAWNFINQEGITNTRPWIITNEDDIWFTKKKDENTVYAFLTNVPDWARGARKEFVLKTVEATGNTQISVLGHRGNIVEYQTDNDPTPRFEQKEDGLHISINRAQRIYNNHKWPYPLVVKLENVQAALDPPHIVTLDAKQQGRQLILTGTLESMGDAKALEVAFEIQPDKGFVENLYTADSWESSKRITLKKTGKFEIKMPLADQKGAFVYRAVVHHPKLFMQGEEKNIVLE